MVDSSSCCCFLGVITTLGSTLTPVVAIEGVVSFTDNWLDNSGVVGCLAVVVCVGGGGGGGGVIGAANGCLLPLFAVIVVLGATDGGCGGCLCWCERPVGNVSLKFNDSISFAML